MRYNDRERFGAPATECPGCGEPVSAADPGTMLEGKVLHRRCIPDQRASDLDERARQVLAGALEDHKRAGL